MKTQFISIGIALISATIEIVVNVPAGHQVGESKSDLGPGELIQNKGYSILRLIPSATCNVKWEIDFSRKPLD